MIHSTIFTLTFLFFSLLKSRKWVQANTRLCWLMKEVTSPCSTWSAAMNHCFHFVFLSMKPSSL